MAHPLQSLRHTSTWCNPIRVRNGPMKHMIDFDADIYFGIVADNLIRNFGTKALSYADYALQKMKAIGDEEGLDLWLGVHEQLTEKAADLHQAPTSSLH